MAVCPNALDPDAFPNAEGAGDCPKALNPPPWPNAEGVDVCPKAETAGLAVLPNADGAPKAGAADDKELFPKALGTELPNAGAAGLAAWFISLTLLYWLRFFMACCRAALIFCAIPW